MQCGVGANESVKQGHPGSQGELGSKGMVSGCVNAVVGWILVAYDGNRGLRRSGHGNDATGSGVKKGVKEDIRHDCYP